MTVFRYKGIKYYNDIIFGNILYKQKYKSIEQNLKLFFINQYKI